MNANPSTHSQSKTKISGLTNSSGSITIPTSKYLQNTPLIFFQPFNIIVFLSFFSPVIIATVVTATSFMSQNMNGFIYLGFLLAAVVIRVFYT